MFETYGLDEKTGISEEGRTFQRCWDTTYAHGATKVLKEIERLPDMVKGGEGWLSRDIPLKSIIRRTSHSLQTLYEIRKPACEKEVNDAMASERYLDEFIYVHIDSNGD